MAQYEFADCAGATLANESAEALYELGIMHASGRSAPVDLMSAHKWFNLAAMKGHADAANGPEYPLVADMDFAGGGLQQPSDELQQR